MPLSSEQLELVESLNQDAEEIIVDSGDVEPLVQILFDNLHDIIDIKHALSEEEMPSFCEKYMGFHSYLLLIDDICNLYEKGEFDGPGSLHTKH